MTVTPPDQELPIQVCVIGSELVAGLGDPRGQGWVGRLAAQSLAEPLPQFYALAVDQETTTDLAERWQGEVKRRFHRGFRHRLVIAPGIADITAGITPARSRLNLADILDAALRLRLPALVVGPPPGPMHLAAEVQDLSRTYGDVASRRGLIYIDTFTPLLTHQDWHDDLSAGDGEHPGQAGYGLIAWLILHSGWHAWLGLPEPPPGPGARHSTTAS